nr:sensor histidine kinase [Clostridia bacterium]
MSLKNFIKEKILLISLLILALVTIEIFLIAYNVHNFIKIYIIVFPLLLISISLSIEYYNKKTFYNKLEKNLQDLNEKYLILEIIETPNFIEGKILKEVIQDVNKSMIENVNKYKKIQEEYKEYIELWIHEIKIPIATSKMIIENNKSEAGRSIDEELDKVEDYIEQALYYARSNTVEKDYIIGKVELREIVNTAVIKNKNLLITNKVNLDLHGLDKWVYTDSKWMVFILNQIIQNAVKYGRNEDSKLEIFAEEEKEKVILFVKDNGIGIKSSEICRVFEKGFTGENGRIIGKKSTGIGLYLCKKLCEKLEIGLELESEKGVGTKVAITFPMGSYNKFC